MKTTRNAIRKPVDVAYLMNMKKYLRVSHIQYTYTRMCIYIYMYVYIYIYIEGKDDIILESGGSSYFNASVRSRLSKAPKP